MLPNFPTESKGLRGLVSENIVSNEDFAQLQIGEIPGLLYDFGDGINLKDATAMLADDRRVNHQNLPANAFSLKEVNEYLAQRNNKPQNPVMNELLAAKMSRQLVPQFYNHYS